MAAMKRSELREAVRQVIREELSDLLPSLMREVLSEAYLRRLVTEHAGSRKVLPDNRTQRPVQLESTPNDLRSVVFGEEPVEEDTPQVQPNDDLGIYQDEARLERNKVQEGGPAGLLSRENPLSFIYEGIDASQPMKADMMGSQPLTEMMTPPQGPMPIPESHNGQGNGRKKNTGFDLEHMKRIVKHTDAKLKAKTEDKAAQVAYEETRIKAMRARLDVPVGR